MPILNGLYPNTYPQYAQYQNQQAMMVPNSTVWITDEKEVNSYPIAPNNAVVLRLTTGERIFVKSADATGRPTVERYERVASESNDAPYAMKDDLATVVSAVKDLSGVVAGIRSEMESIKGDVYGIAGKRKPKKEVIEDDE